MLRKNGATLGPSRRALLSGRDWQQHSMHNNDCPSLPLEMDILPGKMSSSGYDVHMYGKWHLGFHQPEALPGGKGVNRANVFLRGSVNHRSWASNGGGSCTAGEGRYTVMAYIVMAHMVMAYVVMARVRRAKAGSGMSQ